MQLSKRLKTVADAVTKGNKVADVGCDHAYISIYLIEQEIATKVIALDVNKGPIERAKENVSFYGYNQRISTRLSNGLQNLGTKEADTILLAGMGGALMIKILEEGMEVVLKSSELVLQPQSELFLVRKFLHKIGFAIEKEEMVKEDGKYYVVMKAIPESGCEAYDREVFYQYGKLLLQQKELVVKEYLDRELRLRNQVIEELQQNPTEKSLIRLEEIKKEITYIDEALTYYYKHNIDIEGNGGINGR